MTPEVFLPLGVYELVENDLFVDDSAHNRLDDRESEALVLVGRLRPGVTEEAAAPQLEQLARRLEDAYPAANKNQTLVVNRLPRMGISTNPGDDGEFFAVLGLLQAMAGLVLIIACLNLANMLLARASARRREVGIRLALGSGRGRIVGQLLIEGLALSLVGGAAGVLVGAGPWAYSSRLLPVRSRSASTWSSPRGPTRGSWLPRSGSRSRAHSSSACGPHRACRRPTS